MSVEVTYTVSNNGYESWSVTKDDDDARNRRVLPFSASEVRELYQDLGQALDEVNVMQAAVKEAIAARSRPDPYGNYPHGNRTPDALPAHDS